MTICRYDAGEMVVLSSVGVPAFSPGSRWSLEVASLPGSIHETGGPVRIDDFTNAVRTLPGVLMVFHLTGVTDYLVWVAAADAQDLREFVVDHLATHPSVAHADLITHDSVPPGALSYGWPLGLVAEPKSALNVPLRDPVGVGAAFGGGLASFPRSTVKIVATAATIRMAATGITIALRCHHGNRGGAP